jgi:predicted dehydrogenase
MGGWGRNWAKTIILPNRDVSLVGCVDMDPTMLLEAQQELNIAAEMCFPTLAVALQTVACEAVLITTTLSAHVPVARAALEAGKHVLVEKPFAPSIAEAQQLIELAEQRQLLLMVSQNYRFFPAVEFVRRFVREGTLGAVGTVNLDFRRYANTTSANKNHLHHTLWQPLLADMSIHHFDLMRFVLGQEPTRVICQTWNPPWSNFTESAEAAAIITLNSGTVVNYRGSWVSPSPQTSWSGEWHMECTGGEITWSSRNHTLPDSVTIRPVGKRAQHIKLPDYPLTDRHGSLNAFLQAIQHGQEPESSGRDNLKTLALMFTAIESSLSGKPLVLP